MRARPATDPILGVVPADPALRRIAIGSWMVFAVIGAVIIWYVTLVLQRAQAMASYDPRGAFLEVQRIAIPFMVAWIISGIGISVWLLTTALRVIHSGRFPAPGARMVRTTHLRHGAEAHRIGMLMLAVAAIMLGASVAMPVFLRRVMQAVERTTNRFPATPPTDSTAGSRPPAGRPL